MGRKDNYDEVTCCECGQDLTGKIQVYHEGKVMCMNCNVRVNKDEEVVKQRQD